MEKSLLKELRETDPEFTRQLETAARTPRSPEERFQQRVSFVFGNQPKGLDFTREEIEKHLRDMG